MTTDVYDHIYRNECKYNFYIRVREGKKTAMRFNTVNEKPKGYTRNLLQQSSTRTLLIMDRHSFLSSQPYLFPLPSCSWPPQVSSETADQSCRRELLLRDHMLSIEPIASKDGSGLGPAFFLNGSVKDQETDPAMCKFEAAINIIANKKTPTKEEMPRTPLAFKGKVDVESKESIGFFYVEDRAYQVDLGEVMQVDVELSPNETKPPCLLIHFSTCIFRIFSLLGMAADQFSVLNAAKTRLLALIASDYISTFPALNGDISSQSLGNTATSSEQGQKAELSQEKASEEGYDASEKPTERCIQITNTCHRSYNKTREDAQSLNRLLETIPESSRKKTSSVDRNTISNLLNSMAENMSSSFCTQEQLSDAVQTHNKWMKTYHTELDEILSSVWRRPKKRARLSGGSKDISSTLENQPQQPQEIIVAQINDIMAKHKEAIKGKYALSILPRRG